MAHNIDIMMLVFISGCNIMIMFNFLIYVLSTIMFYEVLFLVIILVL